jgi:hypothetical protein
MRKKTICIVFCMFILFTLPIVSATNAGIFGNQQRTNSIISNRGINIINIRFGFFSNPGIVAYISNTGTDPVTVNWWINFTGGIWFNYRIYGPIETTVYPGNPSVIKAAPIGLAFKLLIPLTATIEVMDASGTTVSVVLTPLGYLGVWAF